MEKIHDYFKAQDFQDRYSVGLLNPRHIIINFWGEQDFHRFYSRMLWYVDDYPMRILKWTQDFQTDRESSLVPVWFKFPGLPIHLFNQDALFFLASLFGVPLRLDSATKNLRRPSVARIQVEIDLLKSLPDRIWIGTGEATGFWQKLEPDEDLPSYCQFCWHVGHPEHLCTVKHPELKVATRQTDSNKAASSKNAQQFSKSSQRQEYRQLRILDVPGTSGLSVNEKNSDHHPTGEKDVTVPSTLGPSNHPAVEGDAVVSTTTMLSENNIAPQPSAELQEHPLVADAPVQGSSLATLQDGVLTDEEDDLIVFVGPLPAAVHAEEIAPSVGVSPLDQVEGPISEALVKEAVVDHPATPAPLVDDPLHLHVATPTDLPTVEEAQSLAVAAVSAFGNLNPYATEYLPKPPLSEGPPLDAIKSGQQPSDTYATVVCHASMPVPVAHFSGSTMQHAAMHHTLGNMFSFNNATGSHDSEDYYDSVESDNLQDDDDAAGSTYDITDGSEGAIRQKRRDRRKAKARASSPSISKADLEEHSRILGQKIKKRGRPPGSRNRTFFDVVRTIETRNKKSVSS